MHVAFCKYRQGQNDHKMAIGAPRDGRVAPVLGSRDHFGRRCWFGI